MEESTLKWPTDKEREEMEEDGLLEEEGLDSCGFCKFVG